MDTAVQRTDSEAGYARAQEAESAQAEVVAGARVSPTLVEWLCCVGICFPALVLLLIPGKEFGLDWPGHLWMAAYHGEYFRQHLAFPAVLNTDYLSGMHYPVFYGFLFFPVVGLLSIPLGADWAMRLVVAAVLIVQCRQTFLLMRSVGGGRGLSWVVAAVFSWSTYALTNLYNRGAIPEYVAVALLASSVCLFGRVFLAGSAGQATRFLRLEAFLFYTLCAGVHPLTAVFGGLFVAAVVLVMFSLQRRRWSVLVWGACGVLAVLVVLSPWLYATASFHGSLALYESTMRDVIHFPESIDRWWVRAAPFPLDVRMAGGQELGVRDTPHLDAQFNFPLLLLGLFLSARLWRGGWGGLRAQGAGLGLWATGWVLFLAALVCSVSPQVFGWLPGFFHGLQFAYRLVSYQNLALLGVVAGATALLSSRAAAGCISRVLTIHEPKRSTLNAECSTVDVQISAGLPTANRRLSRNRIFKWLKLNTEHPTPNAQQRSGLGQVSRTSNVCLRLWGLTTGFQESAARGVAWPALLILCGGIGILGLVIKLIHGSAAMHGLLPDSQQWRADRNQLLHVPQEFYGWPSYAVVGQSPTNCQPAAEVFFPLGTGARFGEVAPVRFESANAQEVILQVQPFPWNHLRLDGQPLAGAERCRRENGYIVSVQPGRHEVVYEWRPDPLWAGLSLVSKWALLAWVGLAITWRLLHRQVQEVTLARPSR